MPAKGELLQHSESLTPRHARKRKKEKKKRKNLWPWLATDCNETAWHDAITQLTEESPASSTAQRRPRIPPTSLESIAQTLSEASLSSSCGCCCCDWGVPSELLTAASFSANLCSSALWPLSLERANISCSARKMICQNKTSIGRLSRVAWFFFERMQENQWNIFFLTWKTNEIWRG